MGLPQELKDELAESLSGALTQSEANKTIEQIDKVYDWYTEYVDFETFNQLSEEQKDVAGQIIIDFTALVHYRQHTKPEEWDINTLKDYAESTIVDEKYLENEEYFESVSPVLTSFFTFLEQKNYLNKANELKKQAAKMGLAFKKAYEKVNEEEENEEDDSEINSEDILQELQELYVDYEESDFFSELEEDEQQMAFGILVNFTDFAFQFHKITPDKWNADNVEKVCLNSLPKSYPASEENFKAITPVLISFMKFLQSEDLQEGTERIINRLEKIKHKMVEKAMNEENWDANKTVMMIALENEIDLTNEYEMKDFIETNYNEIQEKLKRFDNKNNNNVASNPMLEEMFKNFSGSLGSQETIVREEPKIGRNDPCSCGSGKKYKKCCGAYA
jgi:hypothetical protein